MISLREIRNHALKLSKEWKNTTYERGESQNDYLIIPRVSSENIFPLALHVSDTQKETIEKLAKTILDVRAEFPSASLANLYNPLTMPLKLLKAHEALDKAVDKLYQKEGFKTDTERVAYLFELNRSLTSLVVEEKPKKRSKNG